MELEHGTLLDDTRASSTVEFGVMAMVYVVVLFGLMVVSDLGMLAKRVQTESRVIAWNALCPTEVMLVDIEARLKAHHQGELTLATSRYQPFSPLTVSVPDNSSAIANAVLTTVVRRIEGEVRFEYHSPWQIGWPGDGPSIGVWDVNRVHVVDTRSRVMVMPPRTLPVVIDPDGDYGGGGGGSGTHQGPPPDPWPSTPTP